MNFKSTGEVLAATALLKDALLFSVAAFLQCKVCINQKEFHII